MQKTGFEKLRRNALAFAVIMVFSTVAGASGSSLDPQKDDGYREFFAAKSFTAFVNEELMRPEVIADLESLLRQYRTSDLSAEEVGELAAKVEYGMRLYGYDALVNVQQSPDGKAPLSLEIALAGRKHSGVDPEAVKKALSMELDSQDGKDLETFLTGAAGTLQSGIEAEDKEQWAVSTAQSRIESAVSGKVNELAGNLGKNVKSQIRLSYDEENGTLRPTGKILIPVYDTSKATYFTQLSMNEGYDDRFLGHAGIGGRFYPHAETLKDRGDIGFGVNAFYDYDFTRGHKRYSLGGEFFYDTLALSGNVYQRLSGWKASEDFDSYLVKERPANGWDIRAKWALPWYTPFQLTGGFTQWYGDNVAPFGASSADDLMKDPQVYDVGASVNLTKSLALSYSHKKAEDGHDNTLSLDFNIPLDNSIAHAFDPAESGEVNTIDQSPYAFVDREENVVLEYAEYGNRYAIRYLGQQSPNVHRFGLDTGLDSDSEKGLSVSVTPHDSCVILDQDGSYTVGNDSTFSAEILSTSGCQQPYTQAEVTVRAEKPHVTSPWR